MSRSASPGGESEEETVEKEMRNLSLTQNSEQDEKSEDSNVNTFQEFTTIKDGTFWRDPCLEDDSDNQSAISTADNESSEKKMEKFEEPDEDKSYQCPFSWSDSTTDSEEEHRSGQEWEKPVVQIEESDEMAICDTLSHVLDQTAFEEEKMELKKPVVQIEESDEMAICDTLSHVLDVTACEEEKMVIKQEESDRMAVRDTLSHLLDLTACKEEKMSVKCTEPTPEQEELDKKFYKLQLHKDKFTETRLTRLYILDAYKDEEEAKAKFSSKPSFLPRKIIYPADNFDISDAEKGLILSNTKEECPLFYENKLDLYLKMKNGASKKAETEPCLTEEVFHTSSTSGRCNENPVGPRVKYNFQMESLLSIYGRKSPTFRNRKWQCDKCKNDKLKTGIKIKESTDDESIMMEL